MPIRRATTSTASSPVSAAATNVDPSLVASFDPDQMTQGGLMDDFDGTVIKARLVLWDYNGTIDHHVLGAALTIAPDEGQGEPFIQHYSAGELDNFVPSNDGRTPSANLDDPNLDPATVEGIYAARVGAKTGLSTSSNLGFLIKAAIDAGFDKARITPAITFLEGTRAHWNRVPQKKRSGIVQQPKAGPDGRPRDNDILVMTSIHGYAGAAAGPAVKTPTPAAVRPNGAAGPATHAAPAPAAAAADATLDGLLVAIVVSQTGIAGENGYAKANLGKLVMSKLPNNLKAKGVKRVQELEFLEGHEEWAYDPETGTLYGV